MAHPQQLGFVRAVAEHLAQDFQGRKVLEIGSYDVNGSVRACFAGSDYLGVDLTPGPGVDEVCAGDEVALPDESVDLAISCECFEHTPRWSETFLNMVRMTRPGGVVLFTCATTGRLEHGTARTSPDMSPGTRSVHASYYRNLTAADFRARSAPDGLFDSHFFLTNRYSNDLYFAGMKAGGPPRFRFESARLKSQCSEKLEADQRDVAARSRFPKVLAATLGAPLRLAQLLPDRQFQNFALPYSRLVRWMFMRRGARTGGQNS